MYIEKYLAALLNIIIEKYFNNTICLKYFYDVDNYEQVIKLENVPVIMTETEPTDFFLNDQWCRNFLMHFNDVTTAFESFEYILKTESGGMYNSRKYLFIIGTSDQFDQFFNSTMLNFVRDLLVLYLPIENTVKNAHTILAFQILKQVDLYTHKYIGVDNNNEPILLDVWFPENYTFKFGNNLFPDKVNNQYGRELRAPCYELIPYSVCTLEVIHGNEHNIIVKYSDRYNFTLNYYPNITYELEYGRIYNNWTGDGALNGLISDSNEYYDIIYGGFPSMHPFTDGIRSVVYKYEVCVPVPKRKYGWFMFVEVFSPNIWIMTLCFFIIIKLLIKFRNYCLRNHINSRHSYASSLHIYGLLINQAVKLTGEVRSSVFLKHLLLLLLICNVLLGTAYNSRLSSVMVSPIYMNDIRTLTELAQSDLKLLFVDDYFDILARDEREVYKTLFEKIELFEDDIYYDYDDEPNNFTVNTIGNFSKLIETGNYAVAFYRRNTGGYFERRDYLESIYGKYKLIQPELFTNYYSLLLRVNSMHTETLQSIVRTALEAGLMNFWEEDALRLKNEDTFQRKIQENQIEKVSIDLNLSHLKGIFAVWVIGLLFSTIIFCGECVVKTQYHILIPCKV